MKNLTWQNPEQLFVAQELINKVKSKCCGIKVDKFLAFSNRKERFESDVLGTLVLKDATICDLCVEQNESSFFPNHEIKEYGYSLLLSDVDVTIWTKD